MIYGLYQYDASAEAAIVAAACLCLILAFSLFFMCLSRSWFMFANIVAIVLEIVGLSTRATSIYRPNNLPSFVISVVLLTLAPSIQAANLYMVAGRVIRRATPKDKQSFRDLWLIPRYTTSFFVVQDIIAFSIQLIGVGVLIKAVIGFRDHGKDPRQGLQMALVILTGGFALQIVSLCAFAMVLIRFQVRSREWWQAQQERIPRRFVLVIFYVLHTSTILLLIRTIYRLNEFTAEIRLSDSFLVTQEWPFWLFEISVIFAIFLSYLIPQYPGLWFGKGGALEHDFKTATRESSREVDVEQSIFISSMDSKELEIHVAENR